MTVNRPDKTTEEKMKPSTGFVSETNKRAHCPEGNIIFTTRNYGRYLARETQTTTTRKTAVDDECYTAESRTKTAI